MPSVSEAGRVSPLTTPPHRRRLRASIDPLAGGTNVMFFAVAAAVIGGTALAGGSGTVIGGFLGALFLGVLRDGFTIQGISAFTFNVILGAAIIISMILNARLARLRRGALLT